MRLFSWSIVSPQSSRRRATAGFTLVELLVVLAIMAILLALSVPAMMSIQSNYTLDATVQGVVAQINLARQSALTSGHPVEVRFYLLADYNGSSTSVFHSGTGVYRGMQCFLQSDPTLSGTPVSAISKPYFFQAPVIIVSPQTITSSSVDVSNLLNNTYSGITSSGSSPTTTPPTGGDSSNPLPPPYGVTPYSYFHFRGNGQTDLSTANSTFSQITLVMETSASKATATTLPPNYATLQINAISGVVTVYRP